MKRPLDALDTCKHFSKWLQDQGYIVNFGHHIRYLHIPIILTLCTEPLLERACMGTFGSTSNEQALYELYLMILLNLIVSNIDMLLTGNTEHKNN